MLNDIQTSSGNDPVVKKGKKRFVIYRTYLSGLRKV